MFAVKTPGSGTNWPKQCGISIVQGEQNARLQILMAGIGGHKNLKK